MSDRDRSAATAKEGGETAARGVDRDDAEAGAGSDDKNPAHSVDEPRENLFVAYIKDEETYIIGCYKTEETALEAARKYDDGEGQLLGRRPAVHPSLAALVHVRSVEAAKTWLRSLSPAPAAVDVFVAHGEPAVVRKLVAEIETELAAFAPRFPTVISPDVSIASTASLGRGCYVGYYARINNAAVVGDFVRVGGFTDVAHDVVERITASYPETSWWAGPSASAQNAR
ncbi:hypothetical protein DFJ74DRAFT_767496 [Hyaloraphidium curvatum]|nr:hypothetical protein DFJ74DRAFT_767496 [Hyaloraphidium curvatum]